jgi:hypothetical protein
VVVPLEVPLLDVAEDDTDTELLVAEAGTLRRQAKTIAGINYIGFSSL